MNQHDLENLKNKILTFTDDELISMGSINPSQYQRGVQDLIKN